MKIGIDLRPLYTGSKYRGVGIYTRETLKQLLRMDRENEYHFLNLYGDFPDDLVLDDRCFLHSYYDGPMITDCGNRNLFRIPELDGLRETQVRDYLQSSKIDVMLFTSPNEYGNPFQAEWFSGVRTASILYDVIPLVFPKQCLFDARYRQDYEASLDFVKQQDMLFAISEFTKQDAVRRLQIPQEKIITVFSGIDERYLRLDKRNTALTKEKYGISGEYFLFAGGIDFKKNIESAIRAFARIPEGLRKKTQFVVAGKAAEDTIRMYRREAENSGVSDEMVFTGFVTDDELIDLYCDAKALVFPSLYEGFGLPVIEAMACGTPVITSNNSSLKEIAEGYAQLVNPQSVSEIAKAMTAVLEEKEKVKAYAEKALHHAQSFTWRRVAEKLYAGLTDLGQMEKPATKEATPFSASDEMLNTIVANYCKENLPFTEGEADRIGRELSALEDGRPIPYYPCGKRILYDFTVVSGWMRNQYVTGIGRVAVQVYHALRRIAQVVPVCTKNEKGKLTFCRMNTETWSSGEKVSARPGDVYFMPEYQVRGVQIPANYPPVQSLREQGIQAYAMLYDILPLLLPQYFEKKTVAEFEPYVKEILSNYDGFITDSRTVADEVIAYGSEHFRDISRTVQKVGFIHPGNNSVSGRDQKGPVPLEVTDFFKEPVFLMVGTVEPRKGHATVLDQFEKLWAEGRNDRLCIIGHCGWNMDAFVQKLRAHPEYNRKLLFLEGASDSVLNYAYCHARALIQASAGEGFGMPLVEAGSYGIPVICSDIPVFHEVAGEHAVYFRLGSDELMDVIRGFNAASVPSSTEIKSATWEETACKIANMLIAGAEWYQDWHQDGTVVPAVNAESGFAVCGEETERAEEAEKREKNRDPVKEKRNTSGDKTLLLVFPNNFLRGGQGTNNRVKAIVRQLKSRGWQIDQLGMAHFSPDSDFNNFEKDNAEGLIRRLYLYDCNRDVQYVYKGKKKIPQNHYLQDWSKPGMHALLNQIVQENAYTAVATFYTYFANLFATAQTTAKKVYFMEDCVFMQQASWGLEKGVTLGKLMDEELEKISLFDEIFCISYDEKLMYEKLSGKKIHFLPHLMPEETHLVSTPVETRKWDVGFVGFNNPFNVEGMNWFVEEVCPLLDPGIRAVLVGSMTKELKHRPANVDVIPFAPSLDELFDDVKINICPMFRGTGMKIKVVEAMARGLPTVCNDRGVDGFPDKMQTGCLVTQEAKEFAEYINRLVRDREFYEEKTEQTKRYYWELFDIDKYVTVLNDSMQ
ncbi:MAG: glycosyltransferase [Oscillospiraceae bacterium]|nr:glycosyltransferase [Oscillospiraceae bacterium]